MGSGRGRRELRESAPAVRLAASGMRAVIEPDRHAPGEFTLTVDGTPQSHVSLDDPTYLQFEYTRRIGHAIDLFRPAGSAITAVHLGAGALTLPRYVEATRPGSRQQVVEYDSELVDFVRTHLPLPAGASVRVRHGDARDVLGRLPAGLRGAVDLVVVDLFVGARTPRHVTSTPFYDLIRPLLADDGLVAVNIADGADQRFARGQLATLRAVFPDVALIVDPQVIKARRFGNYVALASNGTLTTAGLARRLASDPAPGRLMSTADLDAFAASASPVDDASATGSPAPARSIFQVKPSRLAGPDQDA